MSALSEFLRRNSIDEAESLPLIHTTMSYNIRGIQQSNVLRATKCDVFRSDTLNYFFVGRPAYKYTSDVSTSSYWELPCCFIFEFAAVSDVKRIFPFDSGAFSNKLYPDYLKMMNIDPFEVATVPNATGKIIGAFFGSAENYANLKAKAEDNFLSEYGLTVMDTEIKALHRLSTESSWSRFDDRRFSIEVQSTSDVELLVRKPLAVIAPSCYFDDDEFRKHVCNAWDAEAISYPLFTLNVVHTFGQIYEKINEYFRRKGLLK